MESTNRLQAALASLIQQHDQMSALNRNTELVLQLVPQLDGNEIASVMNDSSNPTLAQVLRRNEKVFTRAAELSRLMARAIERRYARLAGIVTDPPEGE